MFPSGGAYSAVDLKASAAMRGKMREFILALTQPPMSYDYESDHTKFMRELLAKKPGLAAEQRKGRAIWWDKKLDAEEQKGFRDGRVEQSAYVYQTKV